MLSRVVAGFTADSDFKAAPHIAMNDREQEVIALSAPNATLNS